MQLRHSALEFHRLQLLSLTVSQSGRSGPEPCISWIRRCQSRGLPGVIADCPPMFVENHDHKSWGCAIDPQLEQGKASPRETTEEFRRDPIKMICSLLDYIYEAVHIIRLRCFGSHSFMVRGSMHSPYLPHGFPLLSISARCGMFQVSIIDSNNSQLLYLTRKD
jgi:hypothetical protein